MADLDDFTRTFRAQVRICDCGCWVWMGSTTDGYGKLKLKGRVTYAHRFAFAEANGLHHSDAETIDHLCSNTRRCVNPEHLEDVTRVENALRANQRRWHDDSRRDCDTNPECPLSATRVADRPDTTDE